MGLSLANQFLSELDPKIVIVCIVILAVAFILSLVKKAIHMAIVVAVLILGCTFIIPKATEFQKNYKIYTNEDEVMVIVVNGKEYKFGDERGDKERIPIDHIEMTKQKNGDYVINIKYGNNQGNYAFTIPSYMRDTIKSYIDKYGYELKLLE